MRAPAIESGTGLHPVGSQSPSLTRSRLTVDSLRSPSGCLWQSISLRSVGSPFGLCFAQSVCLSSFALRAA
jgi:hypothetical protein